jgi:hypothetical protein
MLLISIFFTVLTAYFAKQSYDEYRYSWAMFWCALFGWDLHSLLGYVLT